MPYKNKSLLFILNLMIFLILAYFYPSMSLAGQNDNEFSKKNIVKIDVKISDINEDSALWESIARNLIPLKEGDRYSTEKLLETITILSESNLFKDIHVPDPISEKQGIRLTFTLSPFGRIKDIVVEDAFPIFEKEVVNVMTIYSGDAFVKQKLDEQAPRIVELFKKEGYFNPKVTVSAQKDENSRNFIVFVHIEKGDFFKVKNILMEGNKSFSSARLKLRTKTWKSSVLFKSAARFIQKDLDNDIKNFIKFYRKKGFADVEIKAWSIKNHEEKTVDIKFDIKEGPLYKIGFKGNEAFWDYTLRKDMTLSKDGNKNNFVLKKNTRNMKKYYAQKGYPDTKIESITTDKQAGDRQIRDVTFQIDEGRQYVVSSFDIKGNKAISEKRIRKQILTRTPGIFTSGAYFEKTFEEDISAIKVLYLTDGYTKTAIKKTIKEKNLEEGKKSVEIELLIDEGIQTMIRTVDFQGLQVLTKEQALEIISLKPGGIFRDYMIESDEGAIRKIISEKGYPNIQVKAITDFSKNRSLADLIFKVDQGPFVQVGQIFYTGNFRTNETILNNEMLLSPQDPLSLTKLLESRRNIMSMNALDSAKFRTLGLKEKSAEVDLVIEVVEKKPYFFEIGAGYDTERHFYAGSAVGDHNFIGRNLDLEANVEISQIGYKTEISLMEPRLFSSLISTSTRVFAEKREEFNKEFGINNYGASQDFYRKFLDNRVILNIGFVYEFRKQYLKQIRALTTEEEKQYDPRNIIVASPSIIYRTTDSYVRPKKGTFSAVYMDLSKGFDNSLDDFIKYRLDTRYYYTPFEPLTFAVRGRYGFIEPYGGNKTIPEDQLFFLGGTSTVRGFDENLLRFDTGGNAVGGRKVILGSLEARLDIGMNFEFTTFYDIGSVQQTDGRGGSDDFRASAGIGIRYMTPIGPIGFLYGWKFDPLPSESSGALHFSMGYTF